MARKFILTTLSLISLVMIISTLSVCRDCINHGCASDQGLVFIATPLGLLFVSLIRILTSLETKLILIYRIQEIVYAILIFVPLYIPDHILSMQIGFYIATFTIIMILLGFFYSLTV